MMKKKSNHINMASCGIRTWHLVGFEPRYTVYNFGVLIISPQSPMSK